MAQPDDSSRLDDDTLTRLHDLSQANAQTQPAEHEVAASTLESLVQHSGDHPHTPLHVNLPSDQVPSHPWVASIKHKLAPIAEKLAVREHCGNFVVPRGTNDKVWEPMPIYVRLGMHLLFSTGHKYADSARIESVLKEQSIKQGRIFDSEQGALEHILSFIKTYELEKTLDQLLKPDPKDYKTFNEFFSRRLKPDARPPASPDDDAVVCSAADCRLVVYEDLQSAQSIWIKGAPGSAGSSDPPGQEVQSRQPLQRRADGLARRLPRRRCHRRLPPGPGRLPPLALARQRHDWSDQARRRWLRHCQSHGRQ